MTTETASGLGLPGDIDATPDTIRNGAQALVELRLSLTGQTEETDSRFRSSAGEFTDLVAWDITTAAADELILWDDTTRDLTYYYSCTSELPWSGCSVPSRTSLRDSSR